MAAADLDALAVQKVAQHSAPRERIFQMQFIDATQASGPPQRRTWGL